MNSQQLVQKLSNYRNVLRDGGVSTIEYVEQLTYLLFIKGLDERQTLAERKARMAAAADAFITLPGGVGTLDELFEMITWNDLSIHDKPIVLCHDDGFWDPLLQWLERARSAGAIRPIATRRLHVAQSLPEALQVLRRELAAGLQKNQ